MYIDVPIVCVSVLFEYNLMKLNQTICYNNFTSALEHSGIH